MMSKIKLAVVVLCLLGLAVSAFAAVPTIDGTFTPGEWDSFKLGTVPATSGGDPSSTTLTDVFATHDDTYLYIAWKTDETQAGFVTASAIGLGPNFYISANPYTAVNAGEGPSDRIVFSMYTNSEPKWFYGLDAAHGVQPNNPLPMKPSKKGILQSIQVNPLHFMSSV